MAAPAYDQRGFAGAPALLLLHGTRRTRAMWEAQLDALADEYRVIALDLPAHGALADVPFTLAGATAHVSDAIDRVAGGRAIVVGQSLGGYVGMDLAARRPEQVAGLVLVAATAEPRAIVRHAPGAVGSYLLGAASSRLRRDGGPNGEVIDGAGGLHPDDGGPATTGWLFRGGTRALVGALGEAFLPRLATYPGPTLIVNGEHDALFRRDQHRFLEVAVDGRAVVVPEAGHRVNEEQPVAFNAVVRAFATEALARPGAHDPPPRRQT